MRLLPLYPRPSAALRLGEEDSVALRSDLRIAALRGSAGLRYEAKPEFGARKPPRGTGRCECAAERRRVLRAHRFARAELLLRAGRFPLDQEAYGCRHEEGARELEGVYDGHILGRYHCASPVPAHVEGTLGKLHGPEEPRLKDAAVVIVNLRARTELEEVNSYQGEGAVPPGPLHADVASLHDPDVGLEVVGLPVAAPCLADMVCN